MIDEVFRKNKTDKKITDADERFLKISLMPDGSKVVDAKSSRIAYVADPREDKDAINKSWAEAYFKKEKDAVTKLGESAAAKSAEIDSKLVKFKADKESIERTQGELKALNEDTKTKLEDASAKLNETIKHIDEAKSKLTKFNEDYANTLNINTNVESKASEVKASLESVKAIFNNVTNMGIDIVNVYNKAKQDIATTKADIDTKANLALNTATSSLNEIKTILNDFKGKQTELNALKASLEALKDSLEKLKATGVINDVSSNLTQTYSSKKIEGLIESAKTTLANDIKSKTDSLTSSLTSQSQSITDLSNKITTTQSDLSSLSSNISTTLEQKADKTAFNTFVTKTTNDLNLKANKNDVPSITTLEGTFIKKTEAESRYIKWNSPVFKKLLTADADTASKQKAGAYILKSPEGHWINSLAISTNMQGFRAPERVSSQASSDNYSFLVLKNEGDNRQAVYAQLVKDAFDYVKEKAKEYFTSRDT
ncbi:coiled-coil domain-containing protein, partial [Campylobacter concisus]|uniref:coiled-coil domain-containing protein n=1 Tax=Campylobacter concisus TaxID=199 RepID=UPI00112F9ADB